MQNLLLSQTNIPIDNRPTDVSPPPDKTDVNLDHNRLLDYLTNSFKEAIRYKDFLGWNEKRSYDIKSYYMQKEAAWAQWPWKGASSYRSPLTATLTDTAWAYMMESIWPEGGNPLQIKGSGSEDVRTARILEQYMNTVIENETNLKIIQDLNIFRMFLHGTGVIKTRRRLDGTSIDNSSVSVEDIFVPLNATSFVKGEAEYVHQVIGLTKNELEQRIRSKIYDFKDGDIAPGANISNSITRYETRNLMDKVSGLDMQSFERNQMYFIVESYCTYYDKDSAKPLELIVWWAPNGGKIGRVRLNETGLRPFSRYVAYEYGGRFYGMSLPEKIREIQNKLDYSDKQYTDMLDKASMPAMFLDSTSNFDAESSQRVPGGIYEIGVGNKIIFEPQPMVERGFNDERFNMWQQAEKLTGLIDVVQGSTSRGARTLGETQMRQTAAGTRFKAIFQKYEQGWNDTCQIIYKFQDMYVPRDKKVKIIGYEDYQTLGELFPNDKDNKVGIGIDDNFNFGFSGKPINEQEDEARKFDDAYTAAMANPATISNVANCYRLLEEKFRRNGIRNFSSLVYAPAGVNIYPPQECIERIMSGQFNIQLRPGIDAENYIMEAQYFMRTSMFQYLEPEGKMAVMRMLVQAEKIREGEIQASVDVHQSGIFQPKIGMGNGPMMNQSQSQPAMPQMGAQG